MKCIKQSYWIGLYRTQMIVKNVLNCFTEALIHEIIFHDLLILFRSLKQLDKDGRLFSLSTVWFCWLKTRLHPTGWRREIKSRTKTGPFGSCYCSEPCLIIRRHSVSVLSTGYRTSLSIALASICKQLPCVIMILRTRIVLQKM